LAGCAFAKETAMVACEEPFPIAVTTNAGYPLDQNLYQAVKGLSAAAQVVKPGGTIVCAAECRDGLPSHGSYGQLLASQATPEALLRMITGADHATPDQWQVQIQAQIQMKARVLIKNGCLPPEAVRAAHLEPIDDVGAAVAEATRAAGPHATLCVLPQGPQTIPYLRSAI
jgi:nickel-dependent lactate racemase